MSSSVRPHRRQPTRLPRLWDSPGKNTEKVEVGCHFLLQGIFPTQDWTGVSLIAGRFFTIWATREAKTGGNKLFNCHYHTMQLLLLPYYTILSEKAMAPHSSTLAWKIPWMEEPGGLQFMGSLRVRHDWGTSLSLFTFMHWKRKWQPTPVFLPGESQGWGSLVGCHLQGCTESDMTEVT